jgi:hypothetical protein
VPRIATHDHADVVELVGLVVVVLERLPVVVLTQVMRAIIAALIWFWRSSW